MALLEEGCYWGMSFKSVTTCWRGGSAVKSSGCSSRGPEFSSQPCEQPHGGSQPSEMGSDALCWRMSEESCSVLIYMK